MADKKRDKNMLAWLNKHPDVYERLEQIRSLQSSDPDLDRAELELLELTRSIGASSFKEILQQKCDVASEEALEEPAMRKQGKKN